MRKYSVIRNIKIAATVSIVFELLFKRNSNETVLIAIKTITQSSMIRMVAPV